VEITDDRMIVTIVVDGKAASKINIARLDTQAMTNALEELLETAYIDGKLDERNARLV
jgi:hypothetical protein